MRKVGKPVLFVVNQDKYNNLGYYPFTLSLKNPEVLFAFYAGELVISIAIDLDTIENKFASHNLTATYFDESPWPLKISRLQHEDSEIKDSALRVGWHLFGRLYLEFLNLDWFVEEMAYTVQNRDTIFNKAPSVDVERLIGPIVVHRSPKKARPGRT